MLKTALVSKFHGDEEKILWSSERNCLVLKLLYYVNFGEWTFVVIRESPKTTKVFILEISCHTALSLCSYSYFTVSLCSYIAIVYRITICSCSCCTVSLCIAIASVQYHYVAIATVHCHYVARYIASVQFQYVATMYSVTM